MEDHVVVHEVDLEVDLAVQEVDPVVHGQEVDLAVQDRGVDPGAQDHEAVVLVDHDRDHQGVV